MSKSTRTTCCSQLQLALQIRLEASDKTLFASRLSKLAHQIDCPRPFNQLLARPQIIQLRTSFDCVRGANWTAKQQRPQIQRMSQVAPSIGALSEEALTTLGRARHNRPKILESRFSFTNCADSFFLSS